MSATISSVGIGGVDDNAQCYECADTSPDLVSGQDSRQPLHTIMTRGTGVLMSPFMTIYVAGWWPPIRIHLVLRSLQSRIRR